MRPRRSDTIANCVRMRQCSRANQCRDGRKTACLPVPRLHAVTTGPFAPTRPEIGSALRATRALLSRGRGNPAVLMFREVVLGVQLGLAEARGMQSRLQRPLRRKRPKNMGAEFLGIAGCQPACFGSLPRWGNPARSVSLDRVNVAGRAAGNYRPPACAPQRNARRVRSAELIGGDYAYA